MESPESKQERMEQPESKQERISKAREEEIRKAEEEIRKDAERIDPRTAEMVWSHEQLVDPYRLLSKEEIPPEADCTGRAYFLVDRARGTGEVLVSDVRAAHPEIPDEEWDELMRAAAARDDSPDPFPMFHIYRPSEERGKVVTKLREFVEMKKERARRESELSDKSERPD